MLGLAGLAILAGVALAIATAPSSSEGPLSPPPGRAAGARGEDSSDVAIAARYIGVSSVQLRRKLSSDLTLAEIANATTGRSASGLFDALLAPRAARLRNAVSAGRLSEAKQEIKLAKLSKRLLKEIHRHEGIRVGPVDRATTARYLGLSVERVRAAIRSRHSLAQIASSRRGRSAAGLIRALIRTKTTALAAAVRAGKLSRAARSTSIATLPRRVSNEVYFVPPKRASRAN